jgi:hypothetical protein
MTLCWYVFAGPPKCGSTWLYEQLARHPQIAVAAGKDTYYFADQWHRGRAWYLQHFGLDGHLCAADISHHYLYEPQFVKRLRATVDSPIRVHLMLRDPARRMLSALQYQEAVRGVRVDLNRPTDGFVGHSMYSSHIERLQNELTSDELRVDIFEEFFAEPAKSLAGLLRWINPGLDTMSIDEWIDERPARAARAGRSRLASRTSNGLARALRANGLGRVVGRAKELSVVNKALYRPLERDPAHERETLTHYRHLFAADAAQTAQLLGRQAIEAWGAVP